VAGPTSSSFRQRAPAGFTDTIPLDDLGPTWLFETTGRFMPFMDEPFGGRLAADLLRPQGSLIRTIRAVTNAAVNVEPAWRHNRAELTTGYRAPPG